MPGNIGMISGMFFGFAFAIGVLGAAAPGLLADTNNVSYIFLGSPV